MNTECCICRDLNDYDLHTDTSSRESLSWRVVYNGASFCVTPSLGQIVEGYTILWARRHVPSLVHLLSEERRDIAYFLPTLISSLESIYGSSVVFFEHGQVEGTSAVGCGIEHAHLHLVPVENADSLQSMVREVYSIKETFTSISDCLELFSPDDDYILFGQYPGPVTIHAYGPERTAQAVRRILAASQAVPEKWDWRQDSGAVGVQTACALLKAHLPEFVVL